MRFLLSLLFVLTASLAVSSCSSVVQDAAAPLPAIASDTTVASTETPDIASRRQGAISIVEVYGPRRPATGEASDYRLRLAPGFAWPIQYFWDFGDGTAAVGNNVTHVYGQSGQYTVEVVARNRVNADTARFTVTVESMPSAEPTSSEPPEPFAAPAPFEPGDLVWITNAHQQRESAEAEVAEFVDAGFRSSVVPSRRYGEGVYYVAVGGYKNEDEALKARDRVANARSPLLWLLRLGRSHQGD